MQRRSLVHIDGVYVGSELKQLFYDFILVRLLIENRVMKWRAASVVFHVY